jgi:hypothetical protein
MATPAQVTRSPTREIEALAAEAEVGYDVDTLLLRRAQRGRPAQGLAPESVESVRPDPRLATEEVAAARTRRIPVNSQQSVSIHVEAFHLKPRKSSLYPSSGRVSEIMVSRVRIPVSPSGKSPQRAC